MNGASLTQVESICSAAGLYVGAAVQCELHWEPILLDPNWEKAQSATPSPVAFMLKALAKLSKRMCVLLCSVNNTGSPSCWTLIGRRPTLLLGATSTNSTQTLSRGRCVPAARGGQTRWAAHHAYVYHAQVCSGGTLVVLSSVGSQTHQAYFRVGGVLTFATLAG